MKILLTGKDGQVGRRLQRTLAPLGEVVAVGREVVDLAQPDSIVRTVRAVKPDLIVNAAAYTAVDKAESEPDLAHAINAVAPGIMAEEAGRLGAAIVHYSTDYVFDGKKASPYDESDSPDPTGVYGRTKLAGEQAVQAVGAPYLILRTSWVYDCSGKNFLLTILRLAHDREELKVVDDQTGAPTSSPLIANLTAQILQGGNPVELLRHQGGLYHLTASGQTTWYGFARAIVEGDPRRDKQRLQRLLPITTEEYPTAARRPAYSSLNCAKLSGTFGLSLTEWQVGLGQVFQDMSSNTEVN
ncbi:MAG: dTDP-4-dehydrorhamnose reductase [Gemmatimonadaceae bacterium]|nr:dTDP-4-dehydrorhamnose reductase [Gloeobacterales cyanobacterium ES-bin-141]